MSVWRLLRSNRRFLRLWIAQLISLAGDWFNSVALMGLILELTRSPMAASLLIVANTLPLFLLTPVTGVVADRLDRRHVMIWTNLLQAVLALGFLLVRGPGQVWLIYLCSVALVTCEAFFLPASSAALPNLVSAEELGAANALGSSTWGAMLAIGAALGGLTVAYWGRAVAFQVNSLSFVLAALLVVSVAGPFSKETSRQPPRASDFGDGLRYVGRHRHVLALLLVKSLWGLGSGMVLLLAVMPVQVLGVGDAGIGILYACRGLGTLVGPLLALALPRPWLAGLSISVSGLFCWAFAASSGMLAAAIYVFLSFVGGGALWAMSSTLLQKTVPDEVLGRVFSLDLGALTLTMTVSLLVCGWALEAPGWGPQRVGQLAGVLMGVLGLVWTGWYCWLRPADFQLRAVSDNPEPSGF